MVPGPKEQLTLYPKKVSNLLYLILLYICRMSVCKHCFYKIVALAGALSNWTGRFLINKASEMMNSEMMNSERSQEYKVASGFPSQESGV